MIRATDPNRSIINQDQSVIIKYGTNSDIADLQKQQFAETSYLQGNPVSTQLSSMGQSTLRSTGR